MIMTALAALAAAAQPAAAAPGPGARQRATVIMPEHPQQRRMQEQIGWADAVVSNGVVYVSGVPAFLAPGETDKEKAYARAFEAIGKTLQRAGASWDDVVAMTTYHTDPTGQLETFAKVKARYMKSPPPAWNAIGTSGLLQPGALVEIVVTAHLPDTAGKRR